MSHSKLDVRNGVEMTRHSYVWIQFPEQRNGEGIAAAGVTFNAQIHTFAAQFQPVRRPEESAQGVVCGVKPRSSLYEEPNGGGKGM